MQFKVKENIQVKYIIALFFSLFRRGIFCYKILKNNIYINI